MPAIVVNVYLYEVGIHTIYLTGRGEFDWDIFVWVWQCYLFIDRMTYLFISILVIVFSSYWWRYVPEFIVGCVLIRMGPDQRIPLLIWIQFLLDVIVIIHVVMEVIKFE